ncbi:hypothetical protein BDN70DRAFT_961126 [Pholiota conissans]|uniref:Uncharacterized protein n=1 Tax=Pholiota conissans TaxID=109636 RepID=A0A9P5YTI6_9AGAR|nr:hypothetical protein BDN70DRAFT_961126 [Pholiota conissans]
MRFNVLISLTFLATFVAGRAVIPTDGALSPCSELEALEGAAEKLWGAIMFRSSNAKKARIALEAPAKAEAKAKRIEAAQRAAKKYKGTTNLPDRKTTFHVPGAPATPAKPARTYTGVDVRKAVYEGHKEADRIKNLSKTKQKSSLLKPFHNRLHEVPRPRGAARPLKNMKVLPNNARHPPGKEFPLYEPGSTTLGPARVITQKTKQGHTTVKGVVSHDQSRQPGPGYNDHFKVKGKKH